ncbi:aminotransferase class IV family protein [Natronohydrobacter thiooxidans]|uniref:aminotransferase class IV family protein n=1 Tax=Natronohydrobacter thiooxidans TaxID=87172 RepID=UPI0008FF1796|nr:aminotransferase class IV family protein [Natronohydrobacter thiooxidans]
MENPLRAGADDPGLRLIETVLWDGQRAPRARLHHARLRAGAQALGWACPDVTFAGPTGQPARLRLTLDRQGRTEMTTSPLPPVKPLWRVGLAQARLHSADPWLRVKSTRRAIYDTARATLPAGLDEVIFLNERGEVCDGSITTVFFDRGAGLRTPPLASGLLPGVLRAELACPEEILLAPDLPHLRLWVGNALRGLIPARFIAAE